MRKWLVRLALLTLVPVVAAVAAIAAWVGPFVVDDLLLDRVVLAVALDWRDFGRERAVERLQYELDHQRIGEQVGDSDCTLDEREAWRVVTCRWVARLVVPGTQVAVPLSFRSEALLTPDGDLG